MKPVKNPVMLSVMSKMNDMSGCEVSHRLWRNLDDYFLDMDDDKNKPVLSRLNEVLKKR